MPPAVTPTRKWTVMVFMVVDTTNPVMVKTAEDDLNEMRRAGSSDELEIVIHLQLLPKEGNTPPKRFHIGRRVRTGLAPDVFDMGVTGRPVGRRESLANFLLWAHRNFEAERYVFILWGHSFEMGFGGFTDRDDTLQIMEVAAALGALKTKRFGQKLEILGTSTCDFAAAENAAGLADTVKFLVASEVGIPLLGGWPFEEVINAIHGNWDIGLEDLCTILVKVFVASFKRKVTEDRMIALSALDLAGTVEVSKAVSALSREILGAVAHSEDALRLVSKAYLDAMVEMLLVMTDTWEPAVDFADLCEKFARDTSFAGDPGADGIRAKARDALLVLKRTPFVVAHSGIGSIDQLNGFLALVPGSGSLIQQIIARQNPAAVGLANELKKFADREKEYLSILDFRWPPVWRATGWPAVVRRVLVGLERMRDAPSTDPWCAACSDVRAKIDTTVSRPTAVSPKKGSVKNGQANVVLSRRAQRQPQGRAGSARLPAPGGQPHRSGGRNRPQSARTPRRGPA